MAGLTAAALLACVGAAAADFCADYGASDCAGTPFHATHSCSAHFDMVTVAQRSCVIYHLSLVDGTDSAHCAHARGEGPCAADDATNHFCENYAASDCAGTPFHATHNCSAHYDMISVAQQACVVTHLNLVDGSDSVHCAHARGDGPCAVAQLQADFCADYAASDCAGTPFHATHSCADHIAMLSSASQACVAEHLAMVDGIDSAHCAHARGEGPCDLADESGEHDHAGHDHTPTKASGASSAAASASVVALAAWLVI